MKDVYDRYLESGFLEKNPPTAKKFEATAKGYSKLYRKFLPLNKDARILDVGCGMGHFLYFLKSEGYNNFIGLDISPQQVDFVKKNITENVLFGDVFEYLNRGEFFNLIVLNDVLEHMNQENILKLLRLIINSLKSNGVVFIKTVNMTNPFSSHIRYIDITHQIGFTEESLRQILHVVGFSDVNIFGASYPVISLRSALGKVAENGLHFIFRLMLFVQGNGFPSVMDLDIVAIAHKK